MNDTKKKTNTALIAAISAVVLALIVGLVIYFASGLATFTAADAERIERSDGIAFIPEGYKKLGDNAFYGMQNVTAIYLPESMTEIGKNAFSGASNLQTVVIRTTEPLTIADGAFAQTESLQEICVLSHDVDCTENIFERGFYNLFVYCYTDNDFYYAARYYDVECVDIDSANELQRERIAYLLTFTK